MSTAIPRRSALVLSIGAVAVLLGLVIAALLDAGETLPGHVAAVLTTPAIPSGWQFIDVGVTNVGSDMVIAIRLAIVVLLLGGLLTAVLGVILHQAQTRRTLRIGSVPTRLGLVFQLCSGAMVILFTGIVAVSLSASGPSASDLLGLFGVLIALVAANLIGVRAWRAMQRSDPLGLAHELNHMGK